MLEKIAQEAYDNEMEKLALSDKYIIGALKNRILNAAKIATENSGKIATRDGILIGNKLIGIKELKRRLDLIGVKKYKKMLSGAKILKNIKSPRDAKIIFAENAIKNNPKLRFIPTGGL